ncbi:MBL fold metallo-hydrolase RNA specificity domain-containing protein [Natronospira bacteriovora]|uniref:MBL fold metallo-hydrolase n=1 Tax=Natronospira bacteriovora TaxID=3069753 RepID=A0ABU0W4D5_9GAMM|nr:MBL fold metallo-hydrolase [Natronospira sp. AB-CW4]MDQ2068819.1 MBL fold metallo-hydrolase [Natronospira sp. AB-CW4]
MPEVQIHGAAGTVTGSCFLLHFESRRILLDCGMAQGHPDEEARNRDAFPFDPGSIDAVVLSHAHLDHSGLLPRLVQQGFTGPIYTHRASRDIVGILLEDAAWLAEREAEFLGRRDNGKNGDSVEPLFTMEDVRACMAQIRPLDYDKVYDILPNVRLRLQDAGHILGSAVVSIDTRSGGAWRRLIHTGDLGQKGSPLMPDWKTPEAADLVLMESTYGDRCHRSRQETDFELKQIIQSASEGRGNILIPAFAVGRTQELLYLFGKHYGDWGLDGWQIFLDAPLGIKATEIHARHDRFLRPEAAAWVRQTRFRFPNLRFTESAEQSMAINRIQSGAIIIAGSGMCTGGRIRHHLKHQVGRSGTQIIIAGFQAEGTTGRQLVDGAPSIRLWGEEYRVNARIHTVGGISAHADRDGLCDWYRGFTLPPAVALIHGEEKAREALAATLRERFSVDAACPERGDRLDY